MSQILSQFLTQSSLFPSENKTRRALPVIAKRVSLLTEQAPLMIVISSSTIVLWHLATEDYCGIKKEVRLDFLFWWDSVNDIRTPFLCTYINLFFVFITPRINQLNHQYLSTNTEIVSIESCLTCCQN